MRLSDATFSNIYLAQKKYLKKLFSYAISNRNPTRGARLITMKFGYVLDHNILIILFLTSS